MVARFVGWIRRGFRSENWQAVCADNDPEKCGRQAKNIATATTDNDPDGETVVLPAGVEPFAKGSSKV